MFLLNLVLTALAVYFAKQAYDDYRIHWAMFWSFLFGWNLHVLLTTIL